MGDIPVVSSTAKAASSVVRPVARRVVPVARALGTTGRDVTAVLITDLGRVVEAARTGGSARAPSPASDAARSIEDVPG